MNLSEVENVKNVTFVNTITNNTGSSQLSWSQPISGFHFGPDFAIIKSIILNTTHINDKNIYAIWSSITNDVIASFGGNNSANEAVLQMTPNILLKLNGNPQQTIQFQLMTYKEDGTNQLTGISSNTGIATLVDYTNISITIDFIKLKTHSGSCKKI